MQGLSGGLVFRTVSHYVMILCPHFVSWQHFEPKSCPRLIQRVTWNAFGFLTQSSECEKLSGFSSLGPLRSRGGGCRRPTWQGLGLKILQNKTLRKKERG